ncbi:MAG: hypothetical protein IPL43_00065 [Micropruina sp.]|nr:hypothetical protein [Micropruina sp.]
MADLGLRPEGQRTLTEQQEFYRHAAVLDPEQQQSLRTVTQTWERARYAPPGTSLPDIGAQADARTPRGERAASLVAAGACLVVAELRRHDAASSAADRRSSGSIGPVGPGR